jgi:hypothetical protein
METVRDPLAWVFAFLALSFVTLQIFVPLRVRGAFRVASFVPLAIMIAGVSFLTFAFRKAEGGWAMFPTFLFLVVATVAANIVLALIWVIFRFNKPKQTDHGSSA